MYEGEVHKLNTNEAEGNGVYTDRWGGTYKGTFHSNTPDGLIYCTHYTGVIIIGNMVKGVWQDELSYYL